MIVRVGAALAVAVLAVLVMVPAAPAAAASVAFTISDPRIDEASGLAPGVRTPDAVYVQNDSGDTNRVFAVSRRSGRTQAVVTVAGAANTDWEDVAVAPDAAGVPSLWIADTGDNDRVRREVRLYRAPEPRAARGAITERAVEWRLRYPDGPADAEALAVTPGGVAYLVTKDYLGRSSVYRVPPRPDAGRVQTLRRVAGLTIRASGTAGGPSRLGAFAQLAVTGAAFSRDGTRFVVRTYTDAYVWRVDGDLASTIRATPTRVALPRQPQGEGVAFADGTGTSLLVDSEGTDQPVYTVPLPGALAARGGGSPVGRVTTPSPGSPSPSASVDQDDDATSRSNLPFVIGAGVVIVLGAVTYTLLHRRHRGDRRD